MTNKLKTATLQVEQLKEEIANKEAALVKAQEDYQQTEKESMKVRACRHSYKGWFS